MTPRSLWRRFCESVMGTDPAAIDEAMSRHLAGNGRKPAKSQCTSTGCGYPAAVWVIGAESIGGGVHHLCHGCLDEGTAHGWWRASLGANPTALDFEVAADLPLIEAFANGEVA